MKICQISFYLLLNHKIRFHVFEGFNFGGLKEYGPGLRRLIFRTGAGMEEGGRVFGGGVVR